MVLPRVEGKIAKATASTAGPTTAELAATVRRHSLSLSNPSHTRASPLDAAVDSRLHPHKPTVVLSSLAIGLSPRRSNRI
ncbi:hypothetical protein RIF29_20605 [Crotalaria pallida]|uniref:Uncharacterized protein n=1 Tax=Crotalaria pallida TaxID=3830 RepID=A0AAN9I7N6_CROPI